MISRNYAETDKVFSLNTMAREANNTSLPPVIAAYQQWIAKCLIADGSLFSSANLWTPELVEEVRAAFVDHPDMGKEDSFWEKLKKQMQNASPAAKHLMAEMIWAMLAFLANVNADTKRNSIREVWAYSGQVLSENLPLLSDEVLGGIASGGQGYLTGYWRELTFIIKLTVNLKTRSLSERQKLLTSYDDFVAWIAKLPEGDTRQFRHMLRYAAFPDRVERVVSNRHRREILERCGIASKKQTGNWSDQQLDEALFNLRTKLQKEYPGQILDFYESPLKARWWPDEESPNSPMTLNETNTTDKLPDVAIHSLVYDTNISVKIEIEPYDKKKAMKGLFLAEPQFDDMLAALNEKKNVVLQGAPGAGKTYVARRLAYALIGSNDPQRIEMVQFHQSYSYEDFIQGFRPTLKGHFNLRYGIFHQFCRRAQREETLKKPYVFIIDEINRGNLSKIFGELMMLIEADKRGKEHAIPLTYSQDADERFYTHVPTAQFRSFSTPKNMRFYPCWQSALTIQNAKPGWKLSSILNLPSSPSASTPVRIAVAPESVMLLPCRVTICFPPRLSRNRRSRPRPLPKVSRVVPWPRACVRARSMSLPASPTSLRRDSYCAAPSRRTASNP
jgi:hypothetical protein